MSGSLGAKLEHILSKLPPSHFHQGICLHCPNRQKKNSFIGKGSWLLFDPAGVTEKPQWLQLPAAEWVGTVGELRHNEEVC